MDQAPGNQRDLQDRNIRRQKWNENFQVCIQQSQKPPGTLHLNGCVMDIRITPSPQKLTLREKESRRQEERILSQLSICSDKRTRKKSLKVPEIMTNWQDFVFFQQRKWRLSKLEKFSYRQITISHTKSVNVNFNCQK